MPDTPARGQLALHLHAHLPFVRHPEYSSFLEERWFFDAITDTYVPLLTRFEQLHSEGVPFRLSMTLSPTLLAMFVDPLLQERFELPDVRPSDLELFRRPPVLFAKRLEGGGQGVDGRRLGRNRALELRASLSRVLELNAHRSLLDVEAAELLLALSAKALSLIGGASLLELLEVGVVGPLLFQLRHLPLREGERGRA